MTGLSEEERPLAEASALLDQGRYAEAIALADAGIGALLHDGLTVDDFVRLGIRGAALESLLRVERRAVLRFRNLHEPLALRWEALRRAGRRAEARQMQLLCTRHFSERASVWAVAGNHALDEHDYDQARAYFARCLRCDPSWTAGLVGMAIVCESRKDWPRALVYRKQVVDAEGALHRRDPPSLQRVVRYAAALARTGRWRQAEVLLRKCSERGAYASLPAERPVLLRVFGGELYAPAIVAGYMGDGAEPPPGAALAVREARWLGDAAQTILACPALDAPTRLKQLGLCKWLAGDHAAAFALLDESEVDLTDDLMVQCLLAWTATTTGADDEAGARRFALDLAGRTLSETRHRVIGDAVLCWAALTLAFEGQRAQAVEGLRRGRAGPRSLVEMCFSALAAEGGEGACALPVEPHESVYAAMQRVAIFRAAHLSAGRSGYEAALASTAALRRGE